MFFAESASFPYWTHNIEYLYMVGPLLITIVIVLLLPIDMTQTRLSDVDREQKY